MFLINIAIKRPVTMGMIFGLIAVLACVFVPKLPLSLVPSVEMPKLSVTTNWIGSTPEEVEKYISSVIEESGSTIEGVVNVESRSENNYSVVEFTFDKNTNIDFARFSLNEKLQFIENKLPDNITPRISAYIPREFRENSFLEYGLSGPYETWELKKIAEKKFKFKLSSITGISDVSISGAQEKIIELKIKDEVMNKIDMNLIRTTLSRFGQAVSIGNIEMNQQKFNVKIEDKFQSLDEILNLKIRRYDGKIIPMHEVVDVSEGLSDAYVYRRYNGEPQVVLSIEKDTQANAIVLSKLVKNILEEESRTLPQNIQFIKLSDEAESIMTDINVLFKRGFASIFIIFAVLIIFLRHFQSTILVLMSIFLSTCLTFVAMYFFGIGLNLLSIAGLALGFGMMVDNSIVVYENIFRNQGRGLPVLEAAFEGSKEVALPIAASTLTTIIVFAPFLYMQGDTKAFYLPFVNAMVLSLLSSLFISFTFIPFVCTHFLKFSPSKIVEEEDFIYHEKLSIYQKVLKFLLKLRWIWIILIAGLVGYSGWIFYKDVDKGEIWSFGKDDYLQIQISLPVGSVISQTNHIAKQFERILKEEDVKEWKTQVYTRYAYLRVDFETEIKETAYPLILREKLKAFAVNYGNCNVYIRGFGPSFGGGGGMMSSNFNITLSGYNFEELKHLAEELKIFMERTTRRVRDINVNATSWYNVKLYEYELEFDREALVTHQLPLNYAVWQLQSMLRNRQGSVNQSIDNEELEFKISSNEESFSVDDLKRFVCYNPDGQSVLFSDICSIEKVEVMTKISRENRQYFRRINFDYRGSYKKGQKFIDEIKATFPLPIGYEIVEQDNENDDKEVNELLYLLFASIILVYMSLASLFESFRYPFVIILTLPLAFVGVSFMFAFADETFNSSARIGLILLSGIVVNNAIILIYRINELRQHGVTREHAILQASQDRIRPILMTSLTTITGMIPMILKSDVQKSDFWRMLSFSTIGGLTAATIFVLLVTPILYRIFSKEHEKVENREVIL